MEKGFRIKTHVKKIKKTLFWNKHIIDKSSILSSGPGRLHELPRMRRKHQKNEPE